MKNFFEKVAKSCIGMDSSNLVRWFSLSGLIWRCLVLEIAKLLNSAYQYTFYPPTETNKSSMPLR